MPSDGLPLLTFADASAFETWLIGQSQDAPGAWLRFAKKGASETTIGKSDAIDCALAHGWVDGQLGSIDDQFFKTRFTPRRPRSAWSRVNRERVERLLAAGRVSPRGLARIEQAKADGRWAAAYPPQSQAEPAADLMTALAVNPGAGEFFETLDSANRYAVLYRIHQTKTPGRRAAKIADMVAMLARRQTIHPPRARRE